MKNPFLPLLLVSLSLGLSACSSVGALNPFSGEEKEEILQGERTSLMGLQQRLQADDIVADAEGFIAPEAWKNDFWPQVGGYPNHAMQHLALGTDLKKIWSADIGKGVKGGLPLTAHPIVFDGLVYTLDTNSKLSALSTENGRKIWSKKLRPKEEDEAVITGGVSYSGGKLYVTSGYNQVLALDPKSGEEIWTYKLISPSRAAPTIMDNRVFVVTVDNRILALDAANGEKIWEYQTRSEVAGLVGMAAPAANSDIVVPVFSSGEMYALRVENGSVVWSENLSPLRRLGGLESIADIRALPVLDKGLVFAVSFSGKAVALEERTGRRVWQREIGSSQTPAVVGNQVFILTPNNELTSIVRESGSIRWVKQLPKFENEKKREKPLVLRGPVFAGGRLILAGSNGVIFEIDPNTGSILKAWDSGKTVSVTPIIAGATLYLLKEDGSLHAYR